MSEPDRCSRCGSLRHGRSPRGLCLICLMAEAAAEPEVTNPPARGTDLTLSIEPALSSVLAEISDSVGGLTRVLLRDSGGDSAFAPIVAPSSDEMPEVRSDRYQLFGEIARGGMGAILKGRDIDLGRDIAIKVLLDSHKEKPDLVKRFVEEAQIGGQLQHPGIVPVHELGSFADRRPYFTMKLVKGRTLAQLLDGRQAPAIDVPRFLSLFESITQTMAYAHARGVIHRDLKPSNVMVGSFGEVQVMDWGLAKVLPRGGVADEQAVPRRERELPASVIRTARSGSDIDASQAGSVLGTPGYMAPEQARGEIDELDERADVFGLGSILCEILTGMPAFAEGDSAERLRRTARGELVNAFDRLETCGAEPELVAIARHCLAPERGDRIRNAGEVSARINAHQAGVQERLRQAELARVEALARAQEEEKRRVLSDELRIEAQGRAVAEARRRSTTLGLAASIVALVAVGGSSAAFYVNQRQASVTRAALALNEARVLFNQANEQADSLALWGAALAGLNGAERIVQEQGDAELKRSLFGLKRMVETGDDAARREAALLSELTTTRTGKQDLGVTAADLSYAAAFHRAGLEILDATTEQTAALLQKRPAAVRAELAGYMDDWSKLARELRRAPEKWIKLLRAAQAIDPDLYRGRIRKTLEAVELAPHVAALRELANEPNADQLPPTSSTLLASALVSAGDTAAAVSLLTRSVERNPSDLWVNYDLASYLNASNPAQPDEAIRYYTAARALRPTTAHGLAHTLDARGRGREAVAIFRDLERRQPDLGSNSGCEGHALKEMGLGEEARAAFERAVATYRRSIAAEPRDAATYHNLATALYGLERMDEAIAACRRAIERQPGQAIAHATLGSLLTHAGEHAAAKAAFQTALGLEPDLMTARANLATELQYEGRFDDAVREFRALIRQAPHLSLLHYNLGNALSGRKDYAEAIIEFREAMRLQPEHVDALVSLGCALVDSGAIDEGVAALRDATRRRPDHSRAWGNLARALAMKGDLAALEDLVRSRPESKEGQGQLGQALFERGRFDLALKPFEKAVALDATDGRALMMLGIDLSRLGRVDEAVATLKRAVAINPQDAGVHMNLGTALYQNHDVDGAIAEFQESLRLRPDDADSLANLAFALHAKGDLDGAIGAFEKATRRDPKNAEHSYSLGQFLTERGRYQEAIAAFRAAIRLRPDLTTARNRLGVVLYQAGELDEGIRTARETARLYPKEADSHYGLGTLLMIAGATDEAIQSFREAIRLNSGHAEAQCNLAQALQNKGEFGEALEHFRRGHELGTKQVGWNYPSAQWVAECERLVALEQLLPEVLRGNKKPKDFAERVELARLASLKRLYAAAAKLCAAAMEAEPKATKPSKSIVRYHAAGYAAMAGTGRGNDKEAVNENERRQWRERALDWLKADLDFWTTQLEEATPQGRQTIRQTLEQWKTDQGLGGVRDEDALKKLASEEQKAWHVFWGDLERVLKRARG
jgi:eukaryotic-like serine/threonine-protein kinase